MAGLQEAPPPEPDRSGPLMAGGIVLTSLGGLLFLVAGVAVLGSLVTGESEKRFGYFVAGIFITILGAAQIWAGALAIVRRRSGKTFGLAVALLGVALGVTGIVESFVAEDALGDLVPSILVLAACVAAVILLLRGTPREASYSARRWPPGSPQ
jgi:hypothetical protein